MTYGRKKKRKAKLRIKKSSALKKSDPEKNKQPLSRNAFMLKTNSILTAEEIQVCLMLQYLIQELAVFIGQSEVLDNPLQSYLMVALP